MYLHSRYFMTRYLMIRVDIFEIDVLEFNISALPQIGILAYSGSGVLFVLKRVFVSFPLRFRFVYVAFRFLPFLRTFLTKNAF